MPEPMREKITQRIARTALSCFFGCLAILMVVIPASGADKAKDEDTIKNANLVLQNMLDTNSVSPAVLSKAACVMILPGVKKVGFGVGGTGGRGPMVCRRGANFTGRWSAPAMFTIGGASVGFQVGGSSSDIVLLMMHPKVVTQVLNGKTKMGTDATAAAGPGATAASASDADILTYGRAKGVFAGVSIGGATVEPDNDANYRLYGKTLTATDIIRGTNVKPSTEGQALVTMLDSKLAKQTK